jgi:hypothetical protein
MTLTAYFSLMRSINSAVVLTGRKGPVSVKADGFTVDDDQSGGSWGDGDGIIEPGELVQISNFVKNDGNITAYQVQLNMTTDYSGVSIVDPTFDIGDLEPDERVELDQARFAMDEGMEPGDVPIYMEFTDLEGYTILDTVYLTVTSVESHPGNVGEKTALRQNIPNPFNPSTVITFATLKQGRVTLSVYDIAGRLIRRFGFNDLEPGNHSIVWDGKSTSGKTVSSGVYSYVLEADGTRLQKKMILVK